MNYRLRYLSLAIALFGSTTAAAADGAELNPTRVQWCESLLALHDRAPAPEADVWRALSEAAARVDEALTDFDGGPEADVNAHARAVDLNLAHQPATEFERQLRLSRGRLAQLRDDVRLTPTFARVDVGAADILAALDDIEASARRRQRATGEQDQLRPVDRRFALKSIAGVGTLGAISFGSTLATLHIPDPTWNLSAFFAGGAVLSGLRMLTLVRRYGRAMRSPETRVRLENSFNEMRVSAELPALRRLRKLATRPRQASLFLAHHGYAVPVSEATVRDLVARARPAAPALRGRWRTRGETHAALVDHVLFRDERRRPVLLTLLRFADAER